MSSEWRWFGHAGHFIGASRCEFHLCTVIGDVLVSTVGQYLPDEGAREIMAQVRGVVLEGKGDARRYDFLKKLGYEEIGLNRLFETMVFRTSDKVCSDPKCMCELPEIAPGELDFEGYNTAGDAARGHMELCRKWANAE